MKIVTSFKPLSFGNHRGVIRKDVIMEDDSDQLWQNLQARLDQRFGKYFKGREIKNNHKSHKRKSQCDQHPKGVRASIRLKREIQKKQKGFSDEP